MVRTKTVLPLRRDIDAAQAAAQELADASARPGAKCPMCEERVATENRQGFDDKVCSVCMGAGASALAAHQIGQALKPPEDASVEDGEIPSSPGETPSSDYEPESADDEPDDTVSELGTTSSSKGHRGTNRESGRSTRSAHGGTSNQGIHTALVEENQTSPTPPKRNNASQHARKRCNAE
eukprot:6495843-Pyramimonas_sp.AAC.1